MRKLSDQELVERIEAVCYARLSMQREDPISVERQIALTTAEARRLGMAPVLFAEEKGHHSGLLETTRPKWMELKTYVEKNYRRIRYLIVQDSSRLSRHMVTRDGILKWLDKLGIQYVSLFEPHLQDQSVPKSQRNLLSNLSGAVDQFAAEQASDKMIRHIAWVKENGGKWGRPLFGLKSEGRGKHRHWVKHEEDFPRFCEALNIYLDGNSHRSTAVIANERGIRWRDRYDELRLVTAYDICTVINRLEEYRGILDDAMLNRAIAARNERHHKWSVVDMGRKPNDEPAILRGLIFCAECQQKIYMANKTHRWKTRKKEYTYQWYWHSHTTSECAMAGKAVQSKVIDEQLWRDLSEFFVLSNSQKDYIASMAEQVPASKGDPIRARRAQIEMRLHNLEDGYLGGVIKLERYRVLKTELEEELKSLPVPTESASPTISKDEALEKLGAMTQLLREHMLIDPARVNHIFKSMLIAVWVDPSTWQIVGYTPRHWCVSMFPSDKVRPAPEDSGGRATANDRLYPGAGNPRNPRRKRYQEAKSDEEI